jgi:hypothetical protein
VRLSVRLLEKHRSRRGYSSLFGGDERDEGDEGDDGAEDPAWRKRGSALLMMRWRRRYAVVAGDSAGEVPKSGRKKEWWNIFMVGVGSISNLYLPVGDINELDLRLPSHQGLAVILEEGIELVEF